MFPRLARSIIEIDLIPARVTVQMPLAVQMPLSRKRRKPTPSAAREALEGGVGDEHVALVRDRVDAVKHDVLSFSVVLPDSSDTSTWCSCCGPHDSACGRADSSTRYWPVAVVS